LNYQIVTEQAEKFLWLKILLIIQAGLLAKLDIQTQQKHLQRDPSNGLNYLIAQDTTVRFPLLMSQERILLGPLAKLDLQMLKEFEFKFKRIFDINSKYDSHCFNQIDTKLIYLRAFYNYIYF
jgi:hypothetical protein